MCIYSLIFDNFWRSLVIFPLLGYIVYKAVDLVPVILAFNQIPKQRQIEHYEKDMVYLYHWPHHWTRQVPNLSPFAIKLETWMRFKKIKYEIVETAKVSNSTKQIPYIMLNGEQIAESSQIMEVLSERFNIDRTDGLNTEQLAVARAFNKLIENSLAWTIFMDRYVYKPDEYTKVFRMVPSEYLYRKLQEFLTKLFMEGSKAQGIGRQSRSWVEEVGRSDVTAISDYLADKKYLMGDTITMVDCVAFGHLCQILFVSFPYFHKAAVSDNLQCYIERVRDTLWQDWHTRVNVKPFEQ